MHINNYDCIYSCYRICVSFRLNDNQYGELLLQFEHWKDKMSDNQYGELLWQLWHWTRWNKWQWERKVAITVDTGQDEMNDNQYG